MNVTNHQITKWREALGTKTAATQETYFVITDKWLRYSKSSLEQDTALSFIRTYSKNSVVTAYYAIRFFYSSVDIEFSIKRNQIAPTQYRRLRPILADDEIKRLIDGSKANFGMVEKGYIALSTVYGLRRHEIYHTTANDINIDEATILIRPAKVKGEIRERIHTIPYEILSVMNDLRDSLEQIKKKPTITTLNLFFDYACEQCNVEIRPRQGFHSIRRNLNSHFLTSDVNEAVINNFLRWKSKAGDMSAHYLRDDTKVDQKIFSVHPYIECWGDND